MNDWASLIVDLSREILDTHRDTTDVLLIKVAGAFCKQSQDPDVRQKAHDLFFDALEYYEESDNEVFRENYTDGVIDTILHVMEDSIQR